MGEGEEQKETENGQHITRCDDVTTLKTHCSPILELLAIRVRPFNPPGGLNSVLLIAVYIPSQVDITSPR